eukprot:1321426-Ditylum_brightwellii.AAC.1
MSKYLNIVGMMLYLISHSRSGARDKGLVISGDATNFDVDCHVDSDFAGLWDSESPGDSDCAQSCTGFVILIYNGSIIWASKLQKKISTSTMEAKYISLSTVMKDLLSFQ